MEIFAIGAVIGLIPAVIAQQKGYSFVLWWFFGAFLFIVALPAALLMKRDTAALERNKLHEGMKKCPFCAELVKLEANVCKHCGREIQPLLSGSQDQDHTLLHDREEVTTHRRVEVPNLDVPDTSMGKRIATEICGAVSRIEPTNALTQEQCEIGENIPTSDNVYDVATISTFWPQAIRKNLGLILAMSVIAIIGVIAGQAISSIGGHTDTTSQKGAGSRSSTPAATQYNAEAKTTESKLLAPSQQLIDVVANPSQGHSADAREVGRAYSQDYWDVEGSLRDVPHYVHRGSVKHATALFQEI